VDHDQRVYRFRFLVNLVSMAAGWSDPHAGWELHLLKTNNFARGALALSSIREKRVDATSRMLTLVAAESFQSKWLEE
jgi:hypothetical protein